MSRGRTQSRAIGEWKLGLTRRRLMELGILILKPILGESASDAGVKS
jgi:hypothetical protein